MASIKEFRGLRPRKELVHLIAEQPYDVVNTSEARMLAQKSRYNFYHISLPEVDLPEGTSVYADIVYERGRENLERFIEEGIFKLDGNPKLYLYSLLMEGRAQTGLVSCIHIDDYLNNIIIKHENIIVEKEEDRRRHLDCINANTGPVLLLYKEDGEKQTLFEEAMKIPPEYDFITDDGVRHVFRVISDRPIIDAFRDSFKETTLYIADGHHRAASAVKVGLQRREENPHHRGEEEYNWFLGVIFPHNQLRVMPYNRVVRDLNGHSRAEYIDRIKEKFYIDKTKDTVPDKRHRFCMYLDGEWYDLEPSYSIKDNSIDGLDTKILQDTILDPILGIKDPTEDKRIGFIGGMKGGEELSRYVDSGEYRVAFSMYPSSIDDVIRISGRGELMPPKSTWLEPKLRSGLVLHLL